MQVLIVDDSATNLALLSRLAQAIGCSTLTYDSPTEALECAPALGFDLAIIDFRMPDVDGIEVIKALRLLPQHQHIPLVMVTTSDDASVRYAALDAGATDFLRKPIDAIEVKSRLRNLLRLREAQRALSDRAAWLAQEVAKATRTLAEREEEIVFRLSRAAESRDGETGAHIQRMAEYCSLIAKGLGLGPDACHSLRLAAPMHDIGKIAVPDAILLKPGKLSAEERLSMERHTLHGEQILSDSRSDLIKSAAQIAASHHERWDGTGYPRGLRGEEIPLFSRIAAVADVFDALTSERPYKEAWAPEDARRFVIEQAGRAFDPQCVEAFTRVWQDVLPIAQSQH